MLKTLRAKLLFFFLITTILSITLVGLISYKSTKDVITNQIEQSFFMYSNNLAISVEELVYKTISDVGYLAENPIINNPESTVEEIRNQFEIFVKHYPIYNDVIFVNKDGIVTVDMIGGIVEGNNFNERLWFQQTMEGSTYFSDVYLSPILNAPILVMGAPVKDSKGEIFGTVSPAINLDEFWQRIYVFSELQSQIKSSSYAFLFNEKGEIIAHPATDKILNDNHFSKQKYDINHMLEQIKTNELCFDTESNEVIAYSQVDHLPGFSNNWYIAVSISESELYAPLTRLLIQYIFIFGIVLILTTFFILKFASYLVTPIEKLVTASSNIAKGKSFTPIKLDSYQEINLLNKQFTQMMNQLEEREKVHKKSTLILETTDNGIFAIDIGTMKITTFNKTCENLFELEKEVVLFKTVNEICQLNKKFDHFIKQSNIVERLQEVPTSNEFQCECFTENDSAYFLLTMTKLPKRKFDQELEVLIVFKDITEKKLMEKEIIRTEKLKLIGELSASFAHEIRNPLTTIRGFIQFINLNENASEFEKKYNKVILYEIDRINGIVSDLMCMAKPNGDKQFLLVNINDLIDDITLLYDGQNTINNVEINKQLDVQIPYFFTYASKIKQVFINIIKNAYEAMPDGGKLKIKTNFLKHENTVEIIFSDTGIGMDQKTLSAINKPFFTTKPNGTGLGMPICYMIIEDLGGSIAVNSKKGRGTSIYVRIPIDEDLNSTE